MCTVLLPPSVNPIAVDKYIISIIRGKFSRRQRRFFFVVVVVVAAVISSQAVIMIYYCHLGCDAMQPGRYLPFSILRIETAVSPGY
jgi:hypothetical protein